MPAPVQDTVFPFLHDWLHLMGHVQPIQPIKVKCVLFSSVKHSKLLSYFSLLFVDPDTINKLALSHVSHKWQQQFLKQAVAT